MKKDKQLNDRLMLTVDKKTKNSHTALLTSLSWNDGQHREPCNDKDKDKNKDHLDDWQLTKIIPTQHCRPACSGCVLSQRHGRDVHEKGFLE